MNHRFQKMYFFCVYPVRALYLTKVVDVSFVRSVPVFVEIVGPIKVTMLVNRVGAGIKDVVCHLLAVRRKSLIQLVLAVGIDFGKKLVNIDSFFVENREITVLEIFEVLIKTAAGYAEFFDDCSDFDLVEWLFAKFVF